MLHRSLSLSFRSSEGSASSANTVSTHQKPMRTALALSSAGRVIVQLYPVIGRHESIQRCSSCLQDNSQ